MEKYHDKSCYRRTGTQLPRLLTVFQVMIKISWKGSLKTSLPSWDNSGEYQPCPLVQGKPRSLLSGKLAQRTFQFFENEAGVHSVSFDLHDDDHRITFEMDHGRETLRLGQGSHISSELNRHLPYTQQMRRSIGASGAWIKPDEYQAKIYFTETPASILYTFRFENNRMNWTSQLRHSLFGPRKLEILKGEF